MGLHKYLHFEPEATVQLFCALFPITYYVNNPNSRGGPKDVNCSNYLLIPELTPYVTQAPSNELPTGGNQQDVSDLCLTYCFLQTKTASDSRVISK